MRHKVVVIPLCLASLLAFGCRNKGDKPAPAADANNATAPTQNGIGAQFADVPEELRNPQDAAGYYALGVALYKNDHDREAVEAFEKSVELDAHNADARRRLGFAYATTGQKKEAEESFRKAAELYEKRVREDSKDADALYNLADSYGRVGDYDKASEAYRRAIKLREPDAPTYYDIGLVYDKLARYDDAAKAFARAVELDPNDYQSQEALDRARDDAKKLKERIDYARKQNDKQRGHNQNNANASNQNGTGATAKNVNQ